jgi:hypothetical protein
MSNRPIPFGYLKTNMHISAEEAARVRDVWTRAMESNYAYSIPVLGNGVEFVQFDKPNNDEPVIVRCSFCGGFAAVKTNCVHCGAPIGIY